MSLPPSLAKYNLHFKKMQALGGKDPVMAYYFKLFLLQICLDHKDEPGVRTNLLTWMDELETEKKAIASQIAEPFVPKTFITNFANRLFAAADKQDREGNADRTVVARFLDASLHYQILEQFGEIPDDIQKRIKYANFKAADITKCMKMGVKPKPGGPDEEIEVAPKEEDQNMNDMFPSVPQTQPKDEDMFPSVPQSAPQQDEDDEMEKLKRELDESLQGKGEQTTTDEFDFPTVPSTLPTNQPIPPAKPQIPQKPATPQIPQKPAQKPVQPIVQAQPIQPSVQAQPILTNYNPSANAVMNAQKACKFANSALDFDDYPTAVRNLTSALKEITGRDFAPR